MLTDLYQLTMMHGYLRQQKQDQLAVFDLFFRSSNEFSAYCIAAGLEQALDYVQNLCFDADDIAYLRDLHMFDEAFLQYLSDFHFDGDIDAMPEGTVCFPGEPLVRVTAKLPQAQLIETAMLNIINHQTLIATKAARVVHAAGDGAVLEFGLRRAQGPDAGIYGARATMIGGCQATSNVLAGQLFNIPVRGTHSHSWVMSFASEIEAFRAYAEAFPDGCLLLVDTYDTLRSGLPNAIQVFRELREQGHEPTGIRLDSGDLAYLSKKARKMLDEAGFPKAQIVASGDLDEEVIWDLRAQGASINTWGVGTRLITSLDHPALGGVYKLAAVDNDGAMTPCIKLSDSHVKVTNPGVKQVWRIQDANGKALADLITLADEVIDQSQPLELFDPIETWKRMTVENFTATPLLAPCVKGGQRVGPQPTLQEICQYADAQKQTLWDEYTRLKNPHVYKVDLSQRLYSLKQSLLSCRKAGAAPQG